MYSNQSHEIAIAQTELKQELEPQIILIEDEELDDFDTDQQLQVKLLLCQAQRLSKLRNNKKNYKEFLERKGWTISKANKYVRLAQTFQGFSLSQLRKLPVDTLFALTQPKYKELVEELRLQTEITLEYVQRRMRQERDRALVQEKQVSDSGWERDANGGGRHIALNLYDQETGIKLYAIAQHFGKTINRVIIEAVAQKYDSTFGNETARVDAQFLQSVTTWEEIANVFGRDRVRFSNATRLLTQQGRSQIVDVLVAFLRKQPEAIAHQDWLPTNLLSKALSGGFRLIWD